MDDKSLKMYKTRMSKPSPRPYDPAAGQRIAARQMGPSDRIHFHTPGRFADVWPYHVLVAGETHFPQDRPAITYRFHAHTLIYTVAGRGDVEVGGHHFTAMPGSVVWLDTATRYAHRCHGEDPMWSYLWLSVAGQGLDGLFSHLQAPQNPVFLPETGAQGLVGMPICLPPPSTTLDGGQAFRMRLQTPMWRRSWRG